jgi:hypothetical protein
MALATVLVLVLHWGSGLDSVSDLVFFSFLVFFFVDLVSVSVSVSFSSVLHLALALDSG